MIPSEYGSTAPTSLKSLRTRYDTSSRPPSYSCARSSARASSLSFGELHGLVHALEDPVHVGAGLDQLGGQPQRLRGRVRVLEPPGVGDEPDVQRLGDLRRERNVELSEQVANDLGRG